jgi:hypothetical protein
LRWQAAPAPAVALEQSRQASHDLPHRSTAPGAAWLKAGTEVSALHASAPTTRAIFIMIRILPFDFENPPSADRLRSMLIQVKMPLEWPAIAAGGHGTPPPLSQKQREDRGRRVPTGELLARAGD